MMTNCGVSSAYGSHRFRKTARFIGRWGASPRAPHAPRTSRPGFPGALREFRCPAPACLPVQGGELLEDVLGLGHGIVETLLRGLLAGEDHLHLLLDRVAD